MLDEEYHNAKVRLEFTGVIAASILDDEFDRLRLEV